MRGLLPNSLTRSLASPADVLHSAGAGGGGGAGAGAVRSGHTCPSDRQGGGGQGPGPRLRGKCGGWGGDLRHRRH
eukprot:959933-Prorocentrum_minimum.AAC.2